MTGAGVLLIVLLVLAAIIFWPLLVIWSLNLLFGLTIPFTFGTWFAVFVLIAAVRGYHISKKE